MCRDVRDRRELHFSLPVHSSPFALLSLHGSPLAALQSPHRISIHVQCSTFVAITVLKHQGTTSFTYSIHAVMRPDMYTR